MAFLPAPEGQDDEIAQEPINVIQLPA
jgi:hypothetical protein